MSLPILSAVPALLLMAHAQPTTPPPPEAQYVSGLPLEWQPALVAAFGAFSRERNPRPACFTIDALVRDGSLLVTFVPGRPLPEDAHVRGGTTSCGTYLTLHMSRDGAVLRRTSVR